ncbi:MAG: Ig-like domain-containing protein, partial [Archangium sp.]
TDAAGNASPNSAAVAFTVDSTQPVSSPVITAPVDGSAIANATPVVTGVAAPLATVNVYADGNTTTPVCTTVAAADGRFSCTVSPALGEGDHTLNATATVGASTSAPSIDIDFTVDTLAPSAPVISSPTAGESVSRTPTISGTAEAGSTVEVRIDGQVVCTVVASSTGAWSCTNMQPLPAGNHVVTATAIDAAGNRSQPSADLSFIVTDMPVKPVITAPTAGQMVTDTTPTITGTAQANSAIVVTVDGMQYCMTTADSTGAWSCTGTALSLGMHAVVATSTTAGGTSTSDTRNFTVVDEQPMTPAAPVIASPNNGITTFDNTPAFSGTAEVGTTVSVKVDGTEVCTATTTAQGTWSCTASSAIADGAHTVTATASRGTATSPVSNARTFTVVTTGPAVTSPVGGTTTGTTTTVTGTAAPGAMVVVKNNGEELCTATADADGNWSCTGLVPAGENTLTAEVSDGNGNTLSSDPVSVRTIRGALTGGGIGAGCSSSPASASMWLAALVLGFLFMRRSKAAGAVAAAVITTGVAQAQTQVAPFELERVRLNPGAADGLLQEGGKLMDPMSLRVSLLGHYQHNPLVVHEDGRPVASLVGSRWTAHLGAAFGITDWLEAGLQIPLVLSQTGNAEGTGYTPITNAVALGTPWLQLRAAPLRERSGAPLDLSFGVAVGFPFGSAASLTRENTVTAVPTIGIGKTLGSMFRIGGNVAVNIRPASGLNDASATQVGSYMTTGLVLSTTGKVLRGELSGRVDIPFTQSPVAGELYAGIRWAPHHLIELSLIGGPGFGTQPGTPAFRVLGGIAFTPSFGGDEKKLPVPTVNECVEGQAHDPKKCPELDLDGDGVKNAADSCVDKPGLAQRNGCPDVDGDGDGVLDLSDKCPKVAGLRDLDGCPEPDADKDGIADARDACPNAAGPASSNGCPDTDGDGFDDANDACVNDAGVAALRGCPDRDTDGDGVVDRLDNCVNEKGVASNQGCPAKQKQLVVITAEKLMILDKVYFATGKASVLPKSDVLLKQVARVLNEHPDVKLVIVEGHTDNVGKADKNMALSQARADAVRTKLIGFGVAAERLESKGYGDTRPLEDNKTPKGREANRRVEFVLGGQK